MTTSDTSLREKALRAKPAAYRCANSFSTNEADMVFALRKTKPHGWMYVEPLYSAGAVNGIVSDAEAEIEAKDRHIEALEAENERYRQALSKIEKAPAWGYPERWETTPAEVRQLARKALGVPE